MRIFKFIIIGVLVLVAPVCALQWGYYSKFRSEITSREISSIEIVANMQKERMESFVAYNLDRLDIVTSRRIFRDLLKDYLKKHDKDSQYQLNRSLADIRRAIPAFDVLSVADLAGRVITSTDNALIGTDVSTQEAFRHGIKHNNVAITFPDDGGGEAYVQLTGPMVIDDQVVAVAILKVNPAELLSLLRGPENVAEAYWTLAQRVDAVHIALITPSTNGTTITRKIISEDSESHLAEAMRGADLTILDQGPPLHTHATRFIPDVGWALLMTHDASSLQKSIEDFRNSLLLIALLLSTYVVGVSLYLNHVAGRADTRSRLGH